MHHNGCPKLADRRIIGGDGRRPILPAAIQIPKPRHGLKGARELCGEAAQLCLGFRHPVQPIEQTRTAQRQQRGKGISGVAPTQQRKRCRILAFVTQCIRPGEKGRAVARA